MRKLGSRALAMLLCIIMILSCMSAAFTVLASAADWKYVQGATYEPVTIYKEVVQPTPGKTYRIGVYYYDFFVSASSNGGVTGVWGTQPKEGTVYYTSDDGSDVIANTGAFSEDNLPNCDFIIGTDGSLKNVSTEKYLNYSGYNYSPALSSSALGFGYVVENNSRKLSFTTYNLMGRGTTRYLAVNNETNPSITYSTGTTYSYITFLEKTTVYKKTSSGEGGYYKYDGEKKFTVDKGTKFNDAYIRNQISVFHKADSSIPDAEAEILDINSDAVTFSWNTPVDTSKISEYTGTVYVNGQALDTITLDVREVGDSVSTKVDPSTSKIEDQFSMTSADDGKMATDKTVRYESDEYGAFGTYENDEFSIALSALGQSFPTVETVESQSVKRNHPDVVFVIDASGSMRVYNIAGGDEICRGEATAKALNEAIKELYEQDPETRIGIVTFSNDYHEAGVFLPLDKYTLPEGQTDYITWDGRMVATGTTPPVVSTSNALYSFSNNRYFATRTATSSTSAPQTYPYYYVDRNGNLSRTDQAYDYSQGKYVVTTTNLGTIADGKYIADGGAYAFYRKGSTIYIFDGATFNGVNTSTPYKTYNNLDLQVKTTSAPTTITNVVSQNGWAGYSNDGFFKPNFSEITKIATVQNGVTYYAYNYYDDTLMIYSSEYPEWPVARMKPSPESGANYAGTYIDDYITITCIGPSILSYTTNTYKTQKGGNVYFEKNDYMMATNFLINSKGQTVMPSSYQFVGNQGTYTQSGLKAAENMFREAGNKENRVPSVVLISDGIPTIGSSNTTNPPLKYGDSGVSGYGLSTDEKFKDDLTNFGLWTIETAISVKNNVQNMYAANNGNKKALFYTIGPGVNYIMGQTVLDPTEENLDKAAAKTTYDDANAESGVGIPADLAKKVRAKYSNLDLVDYADWSYSGNMSGQDLINAFKKVVTSLMEVNRPVVTTTQHTEIIGEASESMVFTDDIGAGMKLTGDPVIRYNNKNYSNTSKETKTVDGLKVTTYKYNYQVTETSTNRRYNLNELTVTVTENKDGTQTVKWYIPSELIPIIVYDYTEEKYISASPIRAVYKVGLTDEAKEEGGVFNTNSTEDKANAEFTPTVGNPYYYDNKEGSDGKMHSTFKTDLDKHTEKVDNVTGTDPDSNHQTADPETGKITTELGNNGEIEIKYTTIEVTKIWADGNDAIGKRPDNIKVRVYKDGSAYGDVYTLTEKDAISKGKDANGEDIWAFQIKGLPYEEGSVYTINEISISGYDTEIVYKDGQPTITNSRPKAKVSYELYLVDKDGNPINDNGETVSFKDRTVKSDIVEINQYLGSTGTIDLDEIEKLLPEGYYIYNPNASYTETYKGNEPSTGSTAKISDSTDTTKVFFPESAKTGSDGTVTGINDYSDVKVAFAIAKKSANVSYELYLVDDKGTPVDDNGNEVTFENRTVKSDLVTVEQYINSTETIDLDELEKILPEGYYIYNPDASYTETYKGDDPSSGSKSTINDNTNTTKVFFPEGATTGEDGTVNGINDYSDVKVSFAIAKSKAQVAYELYLVDENGNTIDDNGNPVSFNNRTVKSDLVTVEQYFNTTETIDLEELQKILPEGYYIYNPDASFTETYKGNDAASGSKATIDDATGTTKVFFPDGTTTDKDGNVTGIDDYSSVKVAFAIAQKKANVSYELYLVDENGTPINDNGETVSFEDRTVKSDLVTVEQYFNSTETIDLDELEKILPEGYYIYNPDASYTETYKGDDPSSGSNAKVTDSTNTTKVFYPEGTTIGKDGTVNGINDYSDVKVSFAIAQKKANVSYELYLVDKDGTPINDNGETVSFEDRTVKSDLVTVEQYFNTTETIDLDELQKILPEGYYIYNPDASYTETYKGDDSTAKITDSTDTTKVFYPEGATTDKNGNVTGVTSYNDVKVAFAIAKIAINPDVIVVDYGKTILCSPLDNDNGNSVKIIGVGPVDGTTYSDTYVSQNGVFRIENNNVIFSPFSYMSSINRVKYYVSTVSNDEAYKQLYSTISVIPATTMYYEDNFGGSQANGGLYINYTGEWITTDGNGNTTAGVNANTDIYDRQDRGEVGQGHTPYGYDSSYDDCTQFSNGTASRVAGTVSLVNGRPQFDASASFEFTGTGFDIISRTDLDCGMITVYVTNSQGKSVNVPVINKGTDELYQIPVISFDCSQYFDKAYDTYTVKINVNAPMAALNISSSVFYLDAIRIYNPMGENSADNKEFNEANDAYNKDHEANAYIASIRDYILQAGKLDETEQFGAVYVDTINNDYTNGGALKPEDYEGAEEPAESEDAPGRDTLAYRTLNQSLIKDFELIGPNEEVYLSPGYGVGFIVESSKKPTTVQLEMKVPSLNKKTASLSVYTYGQKDIGTINITSATEMFYDITNSVKFTQVDGQYRAVVVLENGISAQDLSEIVSITNLKLTYDEDVIALDASEADSFSLDSFDEDSTAVVALKANWSLYEDVFGAVYTHRVAATPDYTISESSVPASVLNGTTATAIVKTSQYVDGLVIKDPNGNEVKAVSITSTVDESKLYTDEYKEAKTWTVEFKVSGTAGMADYTFESANGEGNVSVASVLIKDRMVVSISVASKPDKTTYKVGETFNSDGMTVRVKYSDGTEKVIGSGFSTEDVKFTKTGTQKVKVSYGGAETTLNVKVRYSAAQVIATIFGFGWLFKR